MHGYESLKTDKSFVSRGKYSSSLWPENMSDTYNQRAKLVKSISGQINQGLVDFLERTSKNEGK